MKAAPGANQTLTIRTPTVSETRDVEGNVSRSSSTGAEETVLGNLFERSTRELSEDGSYVPVTRWEARLPAGVGVDHTSEVKGADGRWHRVETVKPRRDRQGIVRFITCELERVGV